MQPKQKKEMLVPSKNEEVVLNYKLEDYYYIKVPPPFTQEPVDDSYTRFKWQKAPLKVITAQIVNLSPEEVGQLGFQEKASWFRYHL